jgi:hypothetical protein
MADPVSLADLLPDRLDSLAERARARLSEDEQVAGMKLAWGYVGSQLQQSLRSTLDIPAVEALASGWATAAQLAAYADPGRHPPGERSVVELGDHELTREFKPIIAVTIGSCPCLELDFTFAVSARFGGVKLAIADGHILGGETGDAWASGQLSLHGVPLHEPMESRKVALPGAFEFAAPGLAISPGKSAV